MGPRIASIDLSRTRIQFDALGDTLTFDATVRTDAGSILPGDSLDYAVGDQTIATLQLNAKLISVGSGRTTLTVRDPETDVIGQAVIIVDQIATTLAVRVDSGESFVRLSAGAHLPLACEAFDKNGFPMLQDTVLVSSLKGTVTAGSCAGARIARSGYDTLVFSLNEARVRVPVIVSTRPDSVGIVAAAQPLTTVARERFVGEDLGNPLILALRPLVQDIVAAYGNPASNLDRARAIRDWVARTAISPDPSVHPDNSTSNLSVLPSGMTWADVNSLVTVDRENEDRLYWGEQYYEGYVMLDRLLGTLDPATGTRANDGMMGQVSRARYRIRDINSYHFTLCSYQAIIANALWAAAGLQALRASTLDHDPAAVFIPEFGRWVYEDPTFSEEYLLDGTGEPLSPTDLLTLSTEGHSGHLKATKLPGPDFDPQPYVSDRTYLKAGHPDGMVIMGSQLYNRVVGQRGWNTRYVQIDVPRLATAPESFGPLVFDPVSVHDAFPMLGVVVQELEAQDSVYVISLSSTFPNHQRFQRRVNGGGWEDAADVDVLPVGQCRVEYRSVDGVGNTGALAQLNVWVPRPEGFPQSGEHSGTRRRAHSCI